MGLLHQSLRYKARLRHDDGVLLILCELGILQATSNTQQSILADERKESRKLAALTQRFSVLNARQFSGIILSLHSLEEGSSSIVKLGRSQQSAIPRRIGYLGV